MSPYNASATALRPLMKMFWSAEGWREPPVPPLDVAAVIADGVMFAQPRSDTHDGWVAAARRAAAAFTPVEVGDAFLESLSSRRLDLRSALGSYAVARGLPEHAFRAARGSPWCAVCELYPTAEEDLNVFSFERFKWGGVRHTDIAYAAFDLEQFALSPRGGATAEDRRLGRDVVEALRALPERTATGKAAAALRMIPSNKAEREILVEVLALAGIYRAPSGIDDEAATEFLAGIG
jgi:hypothetical protein